MNIINRLFQTAVLGASLAFAEGDVTYTRNLGACVRISDGEPSLDKETNECYEAYEETLEEIEKACRTTCEEMCDDEESCTAIEVFVKGDTSVDKDSYEERYCALHFDGEMSSKESSTKDETSFCYSKDIHEGTGNRENLAVNLNAMSVVAISAISLLAL